MVVYWIKTFNVKIDLMVVDVSGGRSGDSESLTREWLFKRTNFEDNLYPLLSRERFSRKSENLGDMLDF